MKLKDFLEMYDFIHRPCRINDNNLNCIARGRVSAVLDKHPELHNAHVVSFGFYDDVLTVRIK